MINVFEVGFEASFDGGTVCSSVDSIDVASTELVRYPNLDANSKLKTDLINLLPKFHGLPTQDPIKHLKNFQVVCSTTRRYSSDEVAIWLFAFPFSLDGRAKE
ncbi:hypothetical protein AHAS_Ahas20G0258600 [Arachis hypogaea]